MGGGGFVEFAPARVTHWPRRACVWDGQAPPHTHTITPHLCCGEVHVGDDGPEARHLLASQRVVTLRNRGAAGVHGDPQLRGLCERVEHVWEAE